MSDNYNEEQKRYIGVGISLGVAVGVAIGSAIGNLAMGIGPGIAIGLAIGVFKAKKHAPKPDSQKSRDDSSEA